MRFNVLFFDLDDTLYPAASGLWKAIRFRIEKYMVEKMNLSADIVPDLRKELFAKHGTTMHGLQENFQLNEQEFLAYVHDIPLTNYIQPDPGLREALCLYPQRKIIFTNADTNHANRVIRTIGLEGCFDQIIDILDIQPNCKPQPEAFQKALQLAHVDDPHECVMIDDALRNLTAAKAAGMYTIQIGAAEPPEGIDASILSLKDLPRVLPV